MFYPLECHILLELPLSTCEQSMKSKGECDDEEETDEKELEKGLHHVREHDHVNPQEGKFSNILELPSKKCLGNFKF
jgi:hypothetical protein